MRTVSFTRKNEETHVVDAQKDAIPDLVGLGDGDVLADPPCAGSEEGQVDAVEADARDVGEGGDDVLQENDLDEIPEDDLLLALHQSDDAGVPRLRADVRRLEVFVRIQRADFDEGLLGRQGKYIPPRLRLATHSPCARSCSRAARRRSRRS